MILILSTSYDYDTQIVIEWLNYFNSSFIRVNDEDLLNGTCKINLDILKSENSYFIHNNKKILFSEINIVWFRKFGFLNTYNEVYGKQSKDIIKFINREFSSFRDTFCNLLKNKRWLYNKNINLSKTKMLILANEVGLNVPITFINNNNIEINFNSITKPLSEAMNVFLNDYSGLTYTKKVSNNKSYALSYIQKEIIKEYEIRTFFIEKKYYSMAIFSQGNINTNDDFRNYDKIKPNRMIPYILPKLIEDKLNLLMDKLKLNTGSVDIIKSIEGIYYFLEINPSGQFGMTSIPCNYNLHKLTAQHLNENNKN